jgi:hypothetical protein
MDIKQDIINETYDDIKQIKKDIKDLHKMFLILGQLVNSQAGEINQIEDNIENAKSKVEETNQDLIKANKYVISNRLFYTGAIVGGVLSGLATYGLSLGIWVTSTVSGSIVGGIIGKNYK